MSLCPDSAASCRAVLPLCVAACNQMETKFSLLGTNIIYCTQADFIKPKFIQIHIQKPIRNVLRKQQQCLPEELWA